MERACIAWVTLHPTPGGWKRLPTARLAFLGAKRTARALGYDVKCVWLGAPKMTPARASQRLRACQAMGLLIAPAPAPTLQLGLPWEEYPAVGIGLSIVSPPLHATANHHYRSAKLAVTELSRRGYRRIGLVLLARANDRVELGWLGGFLVMSGEGGGKLLPPLILPRWDAAPIRRWYARHRPDAIVTRHLEMQTTLAEMSLEAPRDVGLAFLSVPDRSGRLAGIDENAEAVGAGASAMVADMITRGERGIPGRPQRLLFEGTWIDGATVRPAKATSRRKRTLVKAAAGISNV